MDLFFFFDRSIIYLVPKREMIDGELRKKAMKGSDIHHYIYSSSHCDQREKEKASCNEPKLAHVRVQGQRRDLDDEAFF